MNCEYEVGDTEPVGDCGQWEAGIHHKTAEGGSNGIWYQRIVVYGATKEAAETLRNRVINALLETKP